MTFTNRLNPIIPLTYDKPFLRIEMRALQLNEGDTYGTDLQRVLEDLLKEVQTLHPAAIVLLSDGGDNALERKQGPELEKGLKALGKAGRKLKAPVFTVGIGSLEGGVIPDVLEGGKPVISRLEERPLQIISDATQGRYFSSAQFSSVEMTHQLKDALEQYRVQPKSIAYAARSYREYFQIPLALGCLCFLLSWWMPSLRHLTAIAVFGLIPFSDLHASLGDHLFATQRYAEAALWYQNQLSSKNPQWLQDKLYFNLGTSYAALQQMNEALLSFVFISPEAYEDPVFRKRILNNFTYALKMDSLSGLDASFLHLHLIAAIPDLSSEEIPPELREILAPLSTQKIDRKQAAEKAAQIALEKLHEAKAPEIFLEWLLVLLGQLEQQRMLSDSPTTLISQEAQRFFPLALQWQQEQFAEGKCLCQPWDQLFPLFSEGLALSQSTEWVSETFLKWNQALALLRIAPPTQELEEQKTQILNELQRMESQDRPRPADVRLKGEGVLW
jgi:tetratricopeptide (TPR) repeat protein